MTTLPDDTEPSAEALLEDATLAAMVEVERLGRHYSDAEGVLVIEIRTGRLNTIIKSALDRFRAAGVREERDRCFKWAIGRRARSRAAQAIRDGEDPNGHPLDPSLCWRCGATLHPGHDCSGAYP